MRSLVVFVLLAAAPAAASTPGAMAQGLRDAKLACHKASDLKNAATLGSPLLFSDTNGKTAVLVTGIWRPAHMKGARATMLCFYDRANATAEVSEARGWTVTKGR